MIDTIIWMVKSFFQKKDKEFVKDFKLSDQLGEVVEVTQ